MTEATVKALVDRTKRYSPPVETGPPPTHRDAVHLPGWALRLRDWKPRDYEAPRLEDIVHAVEGLIRAGKVGALVAAGGTGKTMMLLTLAVCHGAGGCSLV